MPLELTLLGTPRLADDGAVRSVLQQPRRFALLAYLVTETQGGPVPRDAVLSVFWPDSSPRNGRSSLSQALYYLRQALGSDVIESVGDGALTIPDSAMQSDIARFARAIEAEDWATAADLYEGDFLQGFHAPGAPAELEHWIDRTRARLQEEAAAAAWALAEEAEEGGDELDAVVWARRACRWLPRDEVATRRLMEMLDRLGDRPGVVDAYRTLERELAPLEAEPTPKTKALLAELKEGWASEPPAPETTDVTTAAAPPSRPPASVETGSQSAPWYLALLVIVPLLGFIATMQFKDTAASPLASDATVVVLPVTTDEASDQTARELRSAVIQGLQERRGLNVIVADVPRPADSFEGSAYSLRMDLAVDGAGVRASTHLLETRSERALGSVALDRDTPVHTDGIESLAAEIVAFTRHTLGDHLEREALAREGAPAVEIRTVAEARRLRREANELLSDGLTEVADKGFARVDSLLASVTTSVPEWSTPWTGRAQTALSWSWVDFMDAAGDHARAIDRLRLATSYADSALERNPTSADALVIRARSNIILAGKLPPNRVNEKTARREAAEVDARNLVRLYPGRADGWRALSAALIQQAKFEEAYWALRQALEADRYLGRDMEILLNLTLVAREVGAGEAAIGWCEAVTDLAPTAFATSQCRLELQAYGYVPVDTTQIPVEMDRARHSSMWPRPEPWLRATSAVVYAQAGAHDRAEAILKELGRTADDPQSQVLQAWGWLAVGDTARARRLLNRYVADDPAGRRWVYAQKRFEGLRSGRVIADSTTGL